MAAKAWRILARALEGFSDNGSSTFPDTCLDVAYIGQKSALTFEGCALTGFTRVPQVAGTDILYIQPERHCGVSSPGCA